MTENNARFAFKPELQEDGIRLAKEYLKDEIKEELIPFLRRNNYNSTDISRFKSYITSSTLFPVELKDAVNRKKIEMKRYCWYQNFIAKHNVKPDKIVEHVEKGEMSIYKACSKYKVTPSLFKTILNMLYPHDMGKFSRLKAISEKQPRKREDRKGIKLKQVKNPKKPELKIKKWEDLPNGFCIERLVETYLKEIRETGTLSESRRISLQRTPVLQERLKEKLSEVI